MRSLVLVASCLLKPEKSAGHLPRMQTYLSILYSIAGITDSFGSYESYYMSGTSDTEYSSESGSVEAVGSYYQYDVSITYCFVTSYIHLKENPPSFCFISLISDMTHLHSTLGVSSLNVLDLGFQLIADLAVFAGFLRKTKKCCPGYHLKLAV